MTATDDTELECFWPGCEGDSPVRAHLNTFRGRGDWYVRCHNPQCSAMGPDRPTEAEAVQAWQEQCARMARVEWLETLPDTLRAILTVPFNLPEAEEIAQEALASEPGK